MLRNKGADIYFVAQLGVLRASLIVLSVTGSRLTPILPYQYTGGAAVGDLGGPL